MDYKSLINLSFQKNIITFNLADWESLIFQCFVLLIVLIVTIFCFHFIKCLDCDLSLRFNEIYFDYFQSGNLSIPGKIIWITGASSGIGEALAYQLAQFGVKLIISGRNDNRLERVKKNLQLKGCHENDILVVKFDLRDREAHQPALNLILEKFGNVDIFVNNAGTSQRSRFELIESRVDQDLFENNVFGGVSLTRLLVKHWYSKNLAGHVVVTSSIVGKAALPECASYTASKHALHGYYECLRYEAASKGIKVTMICSGPVKTEISTVSYTGVYGQPLGIILPENSSRMDPNRHGKLMLIAIELQLEESWITIQPFLWYCYAHQYFPTLSKRWLIPMANKLSQSRDN
ncbi:dehydrogenase/reductase SDR family member 7-like [Panonychus citri]|uniref:dehydrogenase/reductase SDR family member 7-like n=1 Tax=Panonychus citri TaxID=50023 RepID=UPI0023072D84|nr:dehydrogenase/reductase SDR family member 7-like [Panonychus citri]